VDPSIRDEVGHYAEYAHAVAGAARALSASVRILAHRAITPALVTLLGAEPTFRHDFWHRYVARPLLGPLLDTPVANLAVWRELRGALGRGPGADGVIFAPTTDHRQLFAWAAWIRTVPPNARPTLCLLLRYTYLDVGPPPVQARAASYARLGFAALGGVGRWVRLLTDSRRLAVEYAALTTMPIEVVPIPHTDHIAESVAASEGEPGRAIRLVALGDARTEKGFVLLTEAIRRLQRAGALGRLEFVIQANIASPVYASLAAPRADLARLGPPAVRLIDRVLPREEYARLLGDADLVLLPYSRRVYYARTSGPFTEALAGGKPVIVTADTWMSEELEQYGAGLTFRDGDPSDLADAILQGRDRLPELSRAARARRTAWLHRHSPSALARTLFARP
jgi:glycosyltransferase involved in cell wall biosynthesis